MFTPQLGNEIVRHDNPLATLEVIRHVPAGPMTPPSLLWRRYPSQRHNASAHRIRDFRRPTSRHVIHQAISTIPIITLQPPIHSRPRRASFRGDLRYGHPIVVPEHKLGTVRDRSIIRIRPQQTLKLRASVPRKTHGRIIAYAGPEVTHFQLRHTSYA
jgi:hypothetical protein